MTKQEQIMNNFTNTYQCFLSFIDNIFRDSMNVITVSLKAPPSGGQIKHKVKIQPRGSVIKIFEWHFLQSFIFLTFS